MDKGRDVRRVMSRFSPAKRQIKQSVHKLLSGLDACDSRGGDAVFPEKPKKERVKKLSVVGRANSVNEDAEMGCSGICGSEEDEEQLRSRAPSPGSSKRFKLPKKFFDDCNGVDHSSVPRKLRSAMKKRGRESVSPPLPAPKKLNSGINGVDTPPKDGGGKKSKLNLKHGGSDRSQKRPISGPITKDEEEVVETLYALAGMFPDNDKTLCKGELIGGSTESKSSTVTEAIQSPAPSPTLVSEEDPKCQTVAVEEQPNIPSCDSLGETVEKVTCLNETPVEEQPDIPIGKLEDTELDGSVPQTIPADEKTVSTSVKFEVPHEQSPDIGVKKLEQQEASTPETKSEVSQGPEQLHIISDRKKNEDLVLWPGLSSTVSLETAVHGPSSHSSAKTQPWLDNSTGIGPSSFGNGVSTEKGSRVTVSKKQPWKRCAAHVHISRLIRELQNSDREERFSIQPKRLRTDEGSKQVVSLVENNPSGLGTGSNVVVSVSSVGTSAVEKNSVEARKGIFLQQELHQDQQRTPASGTYTSQKQSYDFLSLSAGGSGVEANNSTNRVVNDPEPSSQLHVPYLHSLPQHHTLLPFSLPQTRYSSSPYPDQFSAAAAAVTQQVQLQLSPYLSNNLCGSPHMVLSGSKQQQQQQQQHQQHQQLQQQRMWAQLAAQYRPAGVSTSHSPNWQNGRHDPTPPIQYAQGILPPSSSIEVLGPKYSPISQQQQHQLIAISSSLSPATAKRQHSHLPSGFDENGGGFRSDSALPLQLLCNEHL